MAGTEYTDSPSPFVSHHPEKGGHSGFQSLWYCILLKRKEAEGRNGKTKVTDQKEAEKNYQRGGDAD